MIPVLSAYPIDFIHDKDGARKAPRAYHRRFLLSSVEIGTRSTAMPIAHPGLRSTVRGSSTSSSITSLGEGVAVIKVTPSDE